MHVVEHVTTELYTLDSLLPVWLCLLLRHNAARSMLMCYNNSALSPSPCIPYPQSLFVVSLPPASENTTLLRLM